MKSGRGVEVIVGKYKYEGEFKLNKKHGEGKLFEFTSGNTY